MKKDTFYFSHDYNAANDTKILFLRHQLGMEGYGIYWFLIEQLANSGGRLPIDLIPVLSMQMHTSETKVNGVVFNFNLFVIEEGEFKSVRLDNHLLLRNNLSESGKKGALNRWKNGVAIGGAIGEGNAKERKVKEIKVKEINILDDFINKIPKQLLGDEYDNFVGYWTETSKSGKLRYESEKYFDINRRINTWLKNKKTYGNTKNTSPTAASTQRMDALKEFIERGRQRDNALL